MFYVRFIKSAFFRKFHAFRIRLSILMYFLFQSFKNFPPNTYIFIILIISWFNKENVVYMRTFSDIVFYNYIVFVFCYVYIYFFILKIYAYILALDIVNISAERFIFPRNLCLEIKAEYIVNKFFISMCHVHFLTLFFSSFLEHRQEPVLRLSAEGTLY